MTYTYGYLLVPGAENRDDISKAIRLVQCLGKNYITDRYIPTDCVFIRNDKQEAPSYMEEAVVVDTEYKNIDKDTYFTLSSIDYIINDANSSRMEEGLETFPCDEKYINKAIYFQIASHEETKEAIKKKIDDFVEFYNSTNNSNLEYIGIE